MANRIQLRRDTAANWASVNPVLAQGEVGIVTDAIPIQIKVGNGVTAWNSLSYVATGNMDVAGSTLDNLVDGTTYKRIRATLASAINNESRLPTASGTTVANNIGAQTGATTLAKLQTLISSIDNIPDGTSYKRIQAAKADEINAGTYTGAANLDDIDDGTSYKRVQAAKADKINGGTYSEDDIADGTSYKRVQAAKADAINAGRDLGLTRYSLVPLYMPTAGVVVAIKNLGSGGIILVGTRDSNSIIRSTNYGKSWVNVASTTGYSEWFAQNGKNVISAVSLNFGYYLSTDNGATWVGPIIPDGAGGVYASGVWYLNGRWFISGGSTPKKLFYSDVAAPSLSTDWTEITTLTDCISMVYFGTKLYAIKSGDGIYVSTDNGGTWAEVLNGSFASLVIAGSYLVALGATVYRTTDGTTWTNANSNVSLNAATYATVLDTTIFARQNYKYIYFSTDYGTTWHNVGYELPNQSSLGYSLERVNVTVLAGSYDGVYKLVEVVK